MIILKSSTLFKSIEKNCGPIKATIPFLIAMADRAKGVQEKYEDRQTTTADALRNF